MRSITKAQKLQLLGLKTMAMQHVKALEDLQAAVYSLVGLAEEDDPAGWVIDFCYDESISVDKLLKGLTKK